MHFSFSYFKFLVSATNQHGVHSPFIYAFVTKCLYAKKKYSTLKSVNVLLKMIDYFQISEINISKEEVAKEIQTKFPNIKINNTSTYLWYIANLKDEALKKLIIANEFHNDSIVFIDGIYKNKNAWQELIQLEKIKVSVNLYDCGILFFRREQVKEHFKIRI
tara:strand:+ start:23169 stop:23654 length:486 start_codon:yes stop_codon:yes gene_type:complete